MHLLNNSSEIRYGLISCLTVSLVLIFISSNLVFSTPASPDGNKSIITSGTNSSNTSLLFSSSPPNESNLNLNLNLNLSNSTLGLINSTPLSEQFASMDNLTNVTGAGNSFVNDTQLTGTENVTLVANFSSKPVGLETDYLIVDKPLILINNVPLSYEFLNDTSDEITITDILISMRATVKLDNSTTNALPVYIKVFSNPVNTTQNADGSETIVNSPNLVENIEVGGVIFSDASTSVKLYPNGTGSLAAHN